MQFREAKVEDIEQIQMVRNSVNENRLSDPSLITNKSCEEFITARGKGWVCEIENQIVGFAIADIVESNVWALFIKPEFEKKGIGKQLLYLLLSWYFNQTRNTIWLGTAPNTRAEHFYREAGWKETGIHGKGEIKFEMSYPDWTEIKKNNVTPY